MLLYEFLRRYHESGAQELRPDEEERDVLIGILAELEKRLSGPPDQWKNHRKSLRRTRRRHAD